MLRYFVAFIPPNVEHLSSLQARFLAVQYLRTTGIKLPYQSLNPSDSLLEIRVRRLLVQPRVFHDSALGCSQPSRPFMRFRVHAA